MNTRRRSRRSNRRITSKVSTSTYSRRSSPGTFNCVLAWMPPNGDPETWALRTSLPLGHSAFVKLRTLLDTFIASTMSSTGARSRLEKTR